MDTGESEEDSEHRDGLRLTEEEKRAIRARLDAVEPGDEAAVRAKFAEKYGRVGDALLNSRFKALRDLALNVACLWEMLVDPDYTLSWRTKAGIIAALGYFISPLDTVPDAAPVVGFVDDALVVAFVAHLLSEDIKNYRAWRREQGRPLPST